MSEVKRYANSSDDWPAPNGDWVRHTDHLAATAELRRELEELRNRIMWFDFTEALPRPFRLVFVERKDGSAGRAVWDGAYWLMEKDQRGHESEIKVIRWRNILDAEVTPSTSERNE